MKSSLESISDIAENGMAYSAYYFFHLTWVLVWNCFNSFVPILSVLQAFFLHRNFSHIFNLGIFP